MSPAGKATRNKKHFLLNRRFKKNLLNSTLTQVPRSKWGRRPHKENRVAPISSIIGRSPILSNVNEGKTQHSKLRVTGEAGYAYVMVIVAVAVLAILAAAVSALVSYEVRHDKEEELLFRGQAYARAIGDYYMAGPAGKTHSYPRQLEDLLSDPRLPNRRYLRALYPDPFGAEWAFVKNPNGGIMGVASQCHDQPLRQNGFPPEFQAFAGAKHYSDWVFVYQPNGTAPGSQGTGAVPGD